MMSTCQLSVRILHTKEPLGKGLRWLISWLSYLKWGCSALLQTPGRGNEVQETDTGWTSPDRKAGRKEAELIKTSSLMKAHRGMQSKQTKRNPSRRQKRALEYLWPSLFLFFYFISYSLKTPKCKIGCDYVILTFTLMPERLNSWWRSKTCDLLVWVLFLSPTYILVTKSKKKQVTDLQQEGGA